jgi:hypothetical protein
MRLAAFVLALLVPTLALAQPRALRARVRSAVCGEHVERGVEAVTTLRASADLRGNVRLAVDDLSYYCAPAPRFSASVREDGAIVVEVVEPEPPVARCMCAHDVSLALAAVPPGVHPIELRFRDEVVARGSVAVANVRRVE